MKYAIIAAGEGSRLANAGVTTPKPLVRINGERMIDRLIRIFLASDAEAIHIIINLEMQEVNEHLRRLSLPVPLHVIRKNTPSSMHSFYELLPALGDGWFCLTTVDTIFREEAFSFFVKAVRQTACPVDGFMAVTDFIDDETPLYVETDGDMIIRGFHDENYAGSRYVSGGIYCLNGKRLPSLKAAVEGGMSRLRNYQRLLVECGLTLKAVPFPKIIDVDHPKDIRIAEFLLRQGTQPPEQGTQPAPTKQAKTAKTITGIMRAPVFSPNHTGNDAAIFAATAAYLREKGCDVAVHSEQSFLSLRENPVRVFTMLRNRQAIIRLQQWEDAGCRSVNAASGIANAGRERMTALFAENNIPSPESLTVDTHDRHVAPLLLSRRFSSCWLKRGDFHAIHREDVSYARHPDEVQEMLAEYASRGIGRVVINKHLEGDLIKFYGVAASFFYHFYPFENSHSKFGLEKINGEIRGIPFREDELRDVCLRAARVLNLTVYGGDCIVSPDGVIRIIDFNDWPSFAPCRKEAIPAIGNSIIKIAAGDGADAINPF